MKPGMKKVPPTSACGSMYPPFPRGGRCVEVINA